MQRIYLVHWHAAEAEERAVRLAAAGYDVAFGHQKDGKPARAIKKRLPDAVVIDLSRLPSHGRQLATWMRSLKVTRNLPIVFVDGDPEKVARLTDDFPESHVTTWRRIRGTLRRAIRNPPKKVAPPSRPDYSGTPLTKKLGLKPDHVLAILGAPDGFDRTLGALPPGVSVRRAARGAADVIVLFVRSTKELARRFGAAHRALADGGGLWVAWPKRASGIATDLDQKKVMDHGLASGLVDNKICAIDATWSGLRFQRRR